MKRKTIAVCVTGFDKEYESKVIEGIAEKCRTDDINLLIFAALIKKPELNTNRVLPESIINGENEIFNLINYNLADAVIMLGDSFVMPEKIAQICEKAHKNNVPVININDHVHKTDVNVELSDEIAMEFVIRHLVEEHGLTKINFIGGFPGNLQTEERLAAYKKVLTEKNIPIEEDRIAYGEFWKKSVECAEKFMKADEKPQAIVCASDTMAFFCMDYLKSIGMRIPEDIVVTGFDGIKDSYTYSPTLTTVRRAFAESGAIAVEIAKKIWRGENASQTVNVDSVLVKQQSCGCALPENRAGNYNSLYQGHNTYMEFNTYMLEMSTLFARVKNSVELYEVLRTIAGFFKLQKLYVCICSEIEKDKNGFVSESGYVGYRGISQQMVSMFKYGHEVEPQTEFLSENLIPESFLDGERAAFMCFSPIYFRDRFLGYLAYSPSQIMGEGDFFATWLMTISNNIGSYYMNNELEFVISELQNLYVRDPLTSLLNRRGMAKFSVDVVARAKKIGGSIAVICADIDNLKPINDKLGHEAGDNAICRTAAAIENSMPIDAVCTRTGGDEFCVIMCESDENKLDTYISAVSCYLEKYNSTSRLPYKVECTCGYSVVSAQGLESLDDLVAAADAQMYKLKAAKKIGR